MSSGNGDPAQIRDRAIHKGMIIVLANLVLAHIASGSLSWSAPDEYLSIAFATMLFHFVAAYLPWLVWRWYRARPRFVVLLSVQTLLSAGFVFALWWP